VIWVEAKKPPSGAHELWQRCRDIDHAAAGVWKYNAPGMKMKSAGNSFRKMLVSAIFLIANYRMTNVRHMSPQLMLTAGNGLK
jgi:hypothetical protein